MVAPAPWAPMRCNWHRMPVPPSLPRQAATMRRTSTPSEPAGLSTIERRSSRGFLREKVDVVFDLIGGDTQKRSFVVLKEGGHLVAATQPVSQEETARHRVTGAMMRLAPSGDVLGRIARLLEEGTIRPDVANIYALQDAAQAWKDIAGNLPGAHGMSPSGPGGARRRSHGKIVLRVASREHEIRTCAYELYLAREAQPGREVEDWLQAERELTAE
jgi:Zinc-binding dehydrogenase/Protein of unknown function (DUF2934)